MNPHTKKLKNPGEIAIVGIGCYYPGAKSPLELWENILSRKQQFREMPEVRLPPSEYYDEDPSTPDKTYQNKAAVIDGYEFNWLDRRIPKRTYESTDVVHWLALDTALQALADAKYSKENIPARKMGVVLGNTLTGEFTRSNQMLLRWPYVRKTLRQSLKQKGLQHLTSDIEETMEAYYKSVFAPVTEDTLAGGLANTIAGRICNYLDIHGGGYIVDGACSSSLLAITNAANYLELNQMDVVIAGGVDVSLDTFELIGFAKTGALTQDEMRVYDKKGKGFIPGEGCGMVVMKRMEDAIRDGDTIYATLMGWGISSDGKGGITAPSAVGQSMALLRAYQKANFNPENLDFIEGHGTGTTVGDKTELTGINLALNADKELLPRSCGVTSFKSIVGHTKAAAGVGAFIKTVIALNQRVLPPTAGLQEFNPIFEEVAKTVYPLIYGEAKSPDSTLYAGVSAMGFGGINSHTLLRSYGPPVQKFTPSLEVRKLLVSNQESELFVFAADTIQELVHELELCQYISRGISYAELADFAKYMNTQVVTSYHLRAAIVAYTPFDLDRKLGILINELNKSVTPEKVSFEADSIVFGRRKENLKIGVAFPGQGAQRINMTYKLRERLDWARELFNTADDVLTAEGFEPVQDKIYRPIEKVIDQSDKLLWNNVLKQTNFAQPAITVSSLAWYKFLIKLGLKFDYSIGHSLGELSAFYAAGYINKETLIKFAGFRGSSMADCGSGTMASLVCTREKAQEYISKVNGYATIANINAPEQTVVSGDSDAIDQIVGMAEDEHIAAVKLPVSAAFHSKLISDTAEAIRETPILSQSKKDTNTGCKVISSVTSEIIDGDVDLNNYFADQATNQVNFIKAVEVLKDKCDIIVESGPGKVLSGLISNITQQVKSFPVEAHVNSDKSFNVAIANLYVAGVDLNLDLLYENRLVRPFTPIAERKFLVNPLERPFPQNLSTSIVPLNGNGQGLEHLIRGIDFSDDLMSDYLAERGNYIKDIIATDMKYFRPLNGSVSQPTINVNGKELTPLAPVPENNKQSGFKSVLFEKLEKITGFPASEFKPEMKLLDDLNLDSIKAGTLLAGLTKEFNLQGKINGAEFANATLSSIIQEFEKVLPNEKLNPSAPGQPASVKEIVLDMISERTGFPKESIQMEFRLLDDLNLDSIKAGTLLSELIKKFNLSGKIEAAAHSNASIQQIVDTLESNAPQISSTSSKPETDVEAFIFGLVEEKTGFSASGLKPEFRLLDDLNLDSIKAGSILAEIAREFNVQGKLEAARYANASIDKIVKDVEGIIGSTSNNTDLDEEIVENPWVNAFEVALIPESLEISESGAHSYWAGKNVTVLNAQDLEWAPLEKLVADLQKVSGSVQQCEFPGYLERKDIHPADVLVVFMPGAISHEAIHSYTRILAGIASHSIYRSTDLCFVQFNDGHFSKSSNYKKPKALSTVGFASSLHLERENIKVRVIEFDSWEVDLSEKILHEISTQNPFMAIGYVGDERYIMEYNLATINGSNKIIPLSEQDVVLITGGAKGITASCGLALAEKYKCKMALIGSSKLSSGGSEIVETLKKYQKLGVKANYFSCDISNPDEVLKLKKTVEDTLGKVTSIVHGAGRNVPRLAENVDRSEALREISPKVLGAYNLIQAFKVNKLKHFVAFTSIIGVTGMKGNSWYAFANETTDLLLRSLNTETGTRTLSLAYSVWSEVGMGARMGSVETLSHMGIGAIAPPKGIGQFMKWFENSANDQQVVVASRLGGLDTWKRVKPELPKANRYIEDIEYFEPGIELIAKTRLNREHDLYADDHNYRGSLLFPTVFGIEAMAQAVAYVSGRKEFNSLVLENISLTKPIVVPDKGDALIQIKVELVEDGEVQRFYSGISIEDSDFKTDHFSAEFILGEELSPGKISLQTKDALTIDPKTDLYSWLLFQGKRFQLIDKVFSLKEKQAIFSIRKQDSDTSESCFSEEKIKPFILGSPLLRDTLLQSFQLCITQKLVLPVRIKKWAFFNTRVQTGGGFVQCNYVSREGKTHDCIVNYSNPDGTLVETIEGYQVQELGDQRDNPTPEQIATVGSDVVERLKAKLSSANKSIQIPTVFLLKHNKLFHALSTDERHSVEQVSLRLFLNGTNEDIGLSNDELLSFDSKGKPKLSHEGFDVSISHTNSWLLFTLAEFKQGCDIEIVQHRSNDIWRELLGTDLYKIATDIENDVHSDIDLLSTRLWSAKEAWYKFSGIQHETANIVFSESDLLLLKFTSKNEEAHILTFPLQVFPGIEMVFAFVVEYQEQVAVKTESSPMVVTTDKNHELYNTEYGKFQSDFNTTFKDCRGFWGKTYFTNFPLWMGSLRENVLNPIKDQLLNDLGSGDFGMVTNDSSVHIYNEAEALDKITGTLSFTDKCDFENSFMDFKYEWIKHMPNGGLIKIAECYLSTTWVKIMDRGIVKKDPIPAYFMEFLQNYLEPDNTKQFNGLSKEPPIFDMNDLGNLLYESPVMPRPEKLLVQKKYSTGMLNGNTVGNLYYSNYYDWQAKTIEGYLYEIIPDLFLSNGKKGEFLCLESNVNHLQEAMPFEEIEVCMYLEKVFGKGIKFFFEFYSVSGLERRKLAYGSNTLIWAKRENEKLKPVPVESPENMIKHLKALQVSFNPKK